VKSKELLFSNYNKSSWAFTVATGQVLRARNWVINLKRIRQHKRWALLTIPAMLLVWS